MGKFEEIAGDGGMFVLLPDQMTDEQLAPFVDGYEAAPTDEGPTCIDGRAVFDQPADELVINETGE